MPSLGEATQVVAFTGSATFDDPIDAGGIGQQQVVFDVQFPYAPRVVVTPQTDDPVALFFGVSNVDQYGFILSCLNSGTEQEQPTVVWLAT